MKINKAALDQAAAARKSYRCDTPVNLYSVEGEDMVFIAAYLEAIKPAEHVVMSEMIHMLAGFVSPLGEPGTVITPEYIETLKRHVLRLEHKWRDSL